MLMRSTKLGAVAVVLMALFACDKVKAPKPAGPDPLPREAIPRVIAMEGLDKGLYASPAIVEPASPTRPLRVSVPVRNVSRHDLNVQYQFEFFDAQGRPVRSSQNAWRFQHMDQRVEVVMEGNAMDTDAVDWRLKIRPAR